MTAGQSIDFLARLNTLVVGRRGERRAPHKPLYLLLCISSIQRGLPRLQRFEGIRNELTTALRLFGQSTGQVHPEYPFWRLQHDDLVEVHSDGALKIRASNSDPTVGSLIAQNAKGGLLERDYEKLRLDSGLLGAAVHFLLDRHFPPSIHEEVLRFFDLRINDCHALEEKSNAEFQRAVLEAYGERCAITGFSCSFGGRTFGVEAAHIFWPQSGGNDYVTNAIAMTTLHRKLYHLGVLGVNEDYRVLVSRQTKQDRASWFGLSELEGVFIRLPENEKDYPSVEALRWHKKWVFKGEAH